MASVIDGLPLAERQRVIDALLARTPYRKVAKMVGVSHVQVGEYYRKVIAPTMAAAGKLNSVNEIARTSVEQVAQATTLTRAVLQADPYLSRIQKHQETLDKSIKQASDESDGRTVAALIGVDLKGLELDARLTGRLDASAAGSTTIQIVTPAVTINTAQPGGYEPMAIDIGPEK